MTREQAINYLISSGFSEEQVSEVVRALTYEPREAADYENEIADLHNRLDIAEYDKERFREEVTNLEAKIKAQEQEPKTGHWIDDTRLGYHVSVCSNCNWRGHGDTCLIYKPKYCPNCGAKMVEPPESEG